MTDGPPLILASSSPTRRKLLEEAGILHEAMSPALDEAGIKLSLKAEGADAARAAETLAEMKALKIARLYPDALVIGADQILEAGGDWYDKPADVAEASAQLKALRGRLHHLASAVVAVEQGRRVWHHTARPALVMRNFSDRFLADYLEFSGPEILSSVGAYRLEGPGAQLFERIDGDFFTILGLALLPLLDYLRTRGVLAS